MLMSILFIVTLTQSLSSQVDTPHETDPLIPLAISIKSPAANVLRFYSNPFSGNKILQIENRYYKLIYHKEWEMRGHDYPFEVQEISSSEAIQISEGMRSSWDQGNQRRQRFAGFLDRNVDVSSDDHLSFKLALSKGVMNFDPRDYDLRVATKEILMQRVGLGIAVGINAACVLLILRIFQLI